MERHSTKSELLRDARRVRRVAVARVADHRVARHRGVLPDLVGPARPDRQLGARDVRVAAEDLEARHSLDAVLHGSLGKTEREPV